MKSFLFLLVFCFNSVGFAGPTRPEITPCGSEILGQPFSMSGRIDLVSTFYRVEIQNNGWAKVIFSSVLRGAGVSIDEINSMDRVVVIDPKRAREVGNQDVDFQMVVGGHQVRYFEQGAVQLESRRDTRYGPVTTSVKFSSGVELLFEYGQNGYRRELNVYVVEPNGENSKIHILYASSGMEVSI